MKIILLDDIRGVGQRFEEKNVSDGYALNFLLPKRLAVLADKAGQARVKQLKEHLGVHKAEEIKRIEEKRAERRAKSLELEKFRQEQQKQPSS